MAAVSNPTVLPSARRSVQASLVDELLDHEPLSRPTAQEVSTRLWRASFAQLQSVATREAALSSGHLRLPLERYRTQRFFHQIDTSHPRLQLINEEPYILLLPGFLTQTECKELIALQVSSEKRGPSALNRTQAETRTSTTVVVDKNKEVGWLRERIAKLANVAVDQLDKTKLTHYAEGEFFGPHIDTAALALGEVKMRRWRELVDQGVDTDAARQQYAAGFEGPSRGVCLTGFAPSSST